MSNIIDGQGKTMTFNDVGNNHEIIEAHYDALEAYGFYCGVDKIGITREDIDALLNGKIVARNNGEYVQFIKLQEDGDA